MPLSSSDLPRHYDTLSIKYSATSKEIRRAFRAKALELHPDKNPDNPAAADQFDKVNKAYEVLSDEKAKAAYDTKLQVEREREAKWEAANAEIRAMRAKLEKKEKEWDDRRRAKRRRTQEDKTQERNMNLMNDLMNEMAAEESKKDGLRGGVRRTEARPAIHKGVALKVKWKKTDGYTHENLRSLFGVYGEILDVRDGAKKRSAIIVFRKRRDAEECLLQESSRVSNLKISLIKDKQGEDNPTANSGAPSSANEVNENPYAFVGQDSGNNTSSNPYASLMGEAEPSAASTRNKSNAGTCQTEGGASTAETIDETLARLQRKFKRK
jgi:DnaJ homolog subfamily C member 17